jgi:hypothetical protein
MEQKNFVPFTLAWDDNVPLDLSFVFENEKPAGKHGFLGVVGDRLCFEDGAEARFWGTNFNSGACFPDHAYSEMVARRLAKFGVNMVRFHQMDAEWATPNLFTFNRARPKDNTRSFDPESMERLDYLIYCLKQAGIYIYLDMLTYRQFLPGDQIDSVDLLAQAAKPYTYFDPRLIELQKEFNRDLWTHTNPYTRLAYKDDPAIALSEIVNESDPYFFKVKVEPYRTRLEKIYRDWAQERNLSVEPNPVDFTTLTPQIALFFVTLIQGHYREMIAHLRGIGVRIPINGTNWSQTLGGIHCQSVTDFGDSHPYWNFPTWEDPNGTRTRPMVAEEVNSFPSVAAARLLDKPMMITEWDHAWPDPWRAESPLAMASVAALQGWSGVVIHTYRYSTWKPENRIGGGAQTINGIPYRNHFDSFNDPAKFGLFYQAALILRRGDVRPAEKTVVIQCSPEDGKLLLRSGYGVIPALTLTPEVHRVGLSFDGNPDPAASAAALDDTVIDPGSGEVRSDTGELWRSWKRRIGTIDTPRTQAAYGFLGSAGALRLSDLTLEVQTGFATVALSSLSDDPIAQSQSLLLTAIGHCDNTDAQYSPDGTRQLSFGRAPVLIEPIEAKISMHTEHPNLKVWVVSDHGEVVTRLPSEYKDGVLSFAIGAQPAWNPSTMYYLIRR